MPITISGQVNYVLMNLAVDMRALSASATFDVLANGDKVGEITLGIHQADLMGILTTVPNEGKTRADDITDAIYAYAVQTGAISGAI